MTLFDKSLQILELPEILELLAGEAVSSEAKDAARELRPYSDLSRVQGELDETTAAKDMMTLMQAPPFLGIKDVRACVKRADMGGALNIRELLDVSELLRAVSASISYFNKDRKDKDEGTAIDYLFGALKSNKYLSDRIREVIISEEEISDNASSTLADIRRHIKLSEDKIRTTLNKIISSQTLAKALQEPIITIRNNRYVVPVKVEHKASIPGMVHDISSSGATQFIEPMTVVNINNELRELAAREAEEIERILMELSAEVANSASSIISDFEIITKLDFVFAKAKLSYKMDAAEPELSGDKQIKLQRARHPLLPKGEAVPIDITLGGEFDTLIVTGPNTGGKTVALKTLGLMCAMAACGLHIPTGYSSTVPVFGSIFADIGDEQSIEQSLSTFSAHLTNIVKMLDECSCDSLLLFDELGAGTDPVEGAALAIAIIEHARSTGSLIAATTHYAELKEYALVSEGVINASCEFDLETLKPTYRLIIGIPGKSNAFAIAQQLGLPGSIIENAKTHVSTENVAFEETLQGLERTRVALEHERSEAAVILRDAQAEKQKINEMRAKLDVERDKHTEVARREAAVILEDARKTAREVLDEVGKLRKKAADNSDLQKLNDEKTNLLRRLNEAQNSLDAKGAGGAKGSAGAAAGSEKTQKKQIAPGDRVIINSIGTQADVISISKDGTLSLQAGIMKVTAHIDEVTFIESREQIEVKRHISKSEAKLRTYSAKSELDLRGMNTDEALPIMEQYLDNAKMAKLRTVTIIHGKGTGVLRKAVHKSLKSGGHGIKSYRLGVYGEGEDGVTIVEL